MFDLRDNKIYARSYRKLQNISFRKFTYLQETNLVIFRFPYYAYILFIFEHFNHFYLSFC